MNQLHMAEIRDSWPAWVGVSLGFIVTNFTLALSALVLLTGVSAIFDGTMAWQHSAAFTINAAQNLVFCAVVGATVIGASTHLVVTSRRGSLARLSLAGATPKQVVGTIMSQLTAVSLACAVIGGGFAFALLQPTLNFLANERNDGLTPPQASYQLWPVVLAALLAVLVALVGGRRQAVKASRIPPVEALRQATGTTRERLSVGQWIGAAFCLVAVAGCFALIPAITAVRTKETISNLLQVSMVVLVFTGALLALLAPIIVGPVTRAWTRLVPALDPSWELARATTVAKANRLAKSVVPVMMTIGLMCGMVAIGDALNATMAANGYNVQLEHVGAATFLVFLGMPLLIAITGGVGSLIMMSKQREAELALSGIVGTTPAQRVAMPVMEGLIITVTGLLLSVVMVGASVIVLLVGFPKAQLEFAMTPSYLVFIGSVVVTGLITVLATVLPTLRSLNQPEPKVVARLVAQ